MAWSREGGWLDWTGPGQEGLQGHCSGEQKMMLLTAIFATVRSGPNITAGNPGTHLSLPFWIEDWPRLALSKSGEFLLRFVLVERTLFCEEWRARAVSQEPMLFPRTTGRPCPKLLCSLLSTVNSGTAKGQASPRKTRGQEGDEGLGMVAHGLLWRG